MTLVLLGLIIVVAALLILVILAQNPKGGLSSQFGGSGTSNLIGVKKTTDLLETITWTFGIALLVLSLSGNFLYSNNSQEFTSPNVERAQDQITVPTLDLETQDPVDAPVEQPQQPEDNGAGQLDLQELEEGSQNQ